MIACLETIPAPCNSSADVGGHLAVWPAGALSSASVRGIPSPTLPNSLSYDACHDVCANGILLQERPKPLRPASETFWTSERNNDRQYLRRCRRHHRSFRIARGAAVRSSVITKHGHSFQIQIVFANALVRFCCAPRAKNYISTHMRQVIQPNRQAAFHRREIDRVGGKPPAEDRKST